MIIIKALENGKFCVWSRISNMPVDDKEFATIQEAQAHATRLINGPSPAEIEKSIAFIKGEPPADWVLVPSQALPDGYAVYSNKESMFGGKFMWGIFKIGERK